MNITKFFRFRAGALPAVPARSAHIVRFQRKAKPLDPFRPVVRWRVNPATGRLECRWTVIANAPGQPGRRRATPRQPHSMKYSGADTMSAQRPPG